MYKWDSQVEAKWVWWSRRFETNTWKILFLPVTDQDFPFLTVWQKEINKITLSLSFYLDTYAVNDNGLSGMHYSYLQMSPSLHLDSFPPPNVIPSLTFLSLVKHLWFSLCNWDFILCSCTIQIVVEALWVPLCLVSRNTKYLLFQTPVQKYLHSVQLWKKR